MEKIHERKVNHLQELASKTRRVRQFEPSRVTEEKGKQLKFDTSQLQIYDQVPLFAINNDGEYFNVQLPNTDKLEPLKSHVNVGRIKNYSSALQNYKI